MSSRAELLALLAAHPDGAGIADLVPGPRDNRAVRARRRRLSEAALRAEKAGLVERARWTVAPGGGVVWRLA